MLFTLRSARTVASFGLASLLLSAILAWAGPPTGTDLSVYRFYASRDHNSARVAVYRQGEDGLYEPVHFGDLNQKPIDPTQSCDSLLTGLESFSLSMMKSMGYLDDLSLAAQVASSKFIRPEQVTVLEMTRPVLEHALESNPQWKEQGRLAHRPDPDGLPLRHLKFGALRIVSAQTLFPHSHQEFDLRYLGSPLETRPPWTTPLPPGKLERIHEPTSIRVTLNPMPWQHNPTLKPGKLGYFDLDRSKYPLAWELGRAAQVEPAYLEVMMQAALAIIWEELEVGMQADPKEAHLFVHALDPVRKRHFMRAGFTPLEGACPSENDCVLTAPLLKIAEKYPPGKLSKRLAEIMKFLPAGSTFDVAMNLLRRASAHVRAELDFLVPGYIQETPLVVHDTSWNYHLTLEALARRVGVAPEKIDGLVKLLDSYRTDSGRKGRAELHDEPSVDPVVLELYHWNAIRVANLDPHLAMSPSYWVAMVEGVHQYMEDRYAELGITNSTEAYGLIRPRIAVQTRDPRVIRVGEAFAERYGGFKFEPYRDEEGRLVHTLILDYEVRERMRADVPQVEEWVRDHVSQGFWFFRRITALPLKF